MESQGRDTSHVTSEQTDQAQMRNADNINQGLKNSGQDTNFLQQTGEGVKGMAHGAVQVASSLVQGTAVGVANLAEGAASAVKSTMGTNTKQPSKPK